MTDSKLILVGQIAGGFGVKGEVRVTAWTADPRTLLSYGDRKSTRLNSSHRP